MAPPDDGQEPQQVGTAEFVAKNQEQRVVTAPVLLPDREDRHGDVIPKENIEEVAYKFLADYQNVDVMHTLKNVGVPVESYITPTDLTFEMDGQEKSVPQGTWMLSVKVQDDEVWRAVKNGELTGFSIYGAANPQQAGGGAHA